MGMEKFYRTVRRKFGLNKEEMKSELKEEVTQELRNEFEQEISYIEAEMKEYEQLVAEVNHMLSVMRKQRVKKGSSGNSRQIKMDDVGDDMAPLKSKLQELEKSMEDRMKRQKALQ